MSRPITGVLAVDMVYGVLKHYERYSRPVEEVTLAPHHWGNFRDYFVRKYPEMEADIDHAGEIHFKNTRVRKGSLFMLKGMQWKLKTLTIDADYNPAEA